MTTAKEESRANGTQQEAVDGLFELISSEIRNAFMAKKATEGLTQTELAHRLGMSPSNISLLLSGNRKLTLKTAAMMIWALNATPTFSLDYDGKVEAAYPSSEREEQSS